MNLLRVSSLTKRSLGNGCEKLPSEPGRSPFYEKEKEVYDNVHFPLQLVLLRVLHDGFSAPRLGRKL